MNSRLVVLTLCVAALSASGCTRIRNTQGYIGDPELMASIKPGVDNKDSVAKSLGRPSINAQWTDNRWYYVTRQTKQLAFKDPKPASQNVLMIDFDAKGNVTKVGKRGMELAQNVRPNADVTPTLGKHRSFLQQVFGNIGRVGAGPSGAPSDQDNTGGGGGGRGGS